MTTVEQIFEMPGRRVVDGPPHDFADTLGLAARTGSRFTVLRRIHAPATPGLRWDATEWVVHGQVDEPKNLHEMGGRHVCLARCGFGFTRRGALRHMRRDSDTSLPFPDRGQGE